MIHLFLLPCRPIRNFFLLADNNNSNTDNDSNSNNSDNHKRKLQSQQQPQSLLVPYEEFSPLAKSFANLLKNMWSSHRFKSNVDPHMLVQAVSVASNKRFHVGKQAEAGEFMAWLLHMLHLGVGGKKQQKQKRPSSKKKKKNKHKNKEEDGDNDGGPSKSSVIHETFMGQVEVTTVTKRRRRRGMESALLLMKEQEANNVSIALNNNNNENISNLQPELNQDDRAGSDDEETIQRKHQQRDAIQTLADEIIYVEEESVVHTDFMQLTLDIPEKPLFKDQDGGLVIPQEPLVNVLRKFDGVSFCDVLAMQHQQQQSKMNGDGTNSESQGVVVAMRRRYQLKRLPNYLILHLNRFKHNNFIVEKNPTIVMFPVKNFDLSEYVFGEEKEKVPTVEEVKSMSVSCMVF